MTSRSCYRLIDSLDSTRGVYTAALVGRGDITPEEAHEIAESYQEELERIFTEAHIQVTGGADGALAPAADSSAQDLSDPTKVGVPLSSLEIPSSQQAGSGMMIGWTSAVARDVVERIGTPRSPGRPPSPSTPSSRPCSPSGVRPPARAVSTGAWASSSPWGACSWRAYRSAWPVRTPAVPPSPNVTPSCTTTRPARSGHR